MIYFNCSKISLIKLLILYTVQLFITIVVLCLPTYAEDSVDACYKVPDELSKLLIDQFPGFRLPKNTDHRSEDIAYNKKFGGSGCLSVAISDFNGDKKRDIAILLTNDNKTKIRFVAALRHKSGWQIYELPVWCENIQNCYVEALKPGLYKRPLFLDYQITDPNERDQIRSRNVSILAGTIESNGIVYVYKDRKWLHVWVSD